jgi:hypothetical protein
MEKLTEVETKISPQVTMSKDEAAHECDLISFDGIDLHWLQRCISSMMYGFFGVRHSPKGSLIQAINKLGFAISPSRPRC